MKIFKFFYGREIQDANKHIPKIIQKISKLIQFLVVYIFVSNLILVLMHEKPVVAEIFSIGSGAYMVFLLCWCFILFIMIELFVLGVRLVRNLTLILLLFHIYIFFKSFVLVGDIASSSVMSTLFSSFQVFIECVLIILILMPSSRSWFYKER